MVETFETKTEETKKESSNKMKIVAGVIILVALAIILFLFGMTKPSVPGVPKIVVTAGVPEGLTSVAVLAGELPKNFPKQTILPASIVPFRSSDVTYKGVNQKIVEFMSTSTPDQVASLYKKTLPTLKPKWQLKSEAQSGNAKLLLFSNGNDLEVLIVPTATGSQVKLTYYVKI